MNNFFQPSRLFYLMMVHAWIAAFASLLMTASSAATAACNSTTQDPVIILKLDDLVAASSGNIGVSQKWERVTRFLESNHIAASFGIIGESLETENNAYFAWLKERNASGLIEFWNHGYRNRFKADKDRGEVGEFNGTTAEAQAQSIEKTQQLAKQRINVVLHGFGPHSSAVDGHTFAQLDRFPEIRYVWFYKPTDASPHRAIVIKRVAELEAPIFHPNFEAFLKTFANRDRSVGYVTLQGHPNEWDDAGFESFTRVVQWLQKQGAAFCLPSDILSERPVEDLRSISREGAR